MRLPQEVEDPRAEPIRRHAIVAGDQVEVDVRRVLGFCVQ
jgi:hypothetical protein